MSPDGALKTEFEREFERRRRIIADFVRERGTVSFRDFCWALLYHPEAGYYVKGDVELIETCDDFVIDRSLREAAIEIAVEDMNNFGGDTVTLKLLGDEEKVEEGFEGVVVANEYFTSLPFHIVKSGERTVCVKYDGDFVETDCSEEFEEVEEFLSYARPYIRVNRFAVCSDAVRKMEEIASKIDKGYVLVIDYGLPAEEYYSRKMRIACFSRDSFSHNPYTSAGKRAISAPVDFTALIRGAEREGMDVCGMTSYRYFLLNTIGKDETEEVSDFKSIAMPVTIKVLVLQKGVEWRKLKCLRNTPAFGYWTKYNRTSDQGFIV